MAHTFMIVFIYLVLNHTGAVYSYMLMKFMFQSSLLCAWTPSIFYTSLYATLLYKYCFRLEETNHLDSIAKL